MRIPHALDLNIQETYLPSHVSLHLLEEVERNIHPEVFHWDNNFIPTLALFCLRVLANNFEKNPVLSELEKRDQDHIQELISTELKLELVVPLIESEQYWRRRYQSQYTQVPFHTHLGWTWKCLYLEQYLRIIIEQAEPEYSEEETFQPILSLFYPYIHVLQVTQLQQWKPPNTLLPSEYPKIFPTYHISFIPILKYLPYLVQLEICYGMHDVGIDYDPHMFKLPVEDCLNLGKAIVVLKHLKVLKLNRSEVECLHVQALVKNLMYNTSLVELNLNFCKIGDLGAKCLGMMLHVHEKLKMLRLKNNVIGEEGALGIAWALLLPEGAHLNVLDMSMNPLGEAGCLNLMRALVRGPLPRELSLAHCNMIPSSAKYVAAMLRVNTSLRRLNLSGNAFGADGGLQILNSLHSNRRLIEMELRDTEIPEEIQIEIKRLLRQNWDFNPPDTNSSVNMIFIDLLQRIHEDEIVHPLSGSTESYHSDSSLMNFVQEQASTTSSKSATYNLKHVTIVSGSDVI